jgi:hypothetical protein
MESGLAFDDAGLAGKSHALLGDDRIQLFDRIDVLVDDGLIDKDPQRFRRLQFGRVGRQKNQPYAFWDVQSRLAMPAGIIENKHDGPVHTRASFAREQFEHLLEERLRHTVGDVPKGLACCGRDENGHVEPLEAVMAKCDWPLADGRPDTPRDRLQTEPVFVAGKDFDRPVRMFGGLSGDGVAEFFLNASASSGVADFGFLGRGA